MFMRAFSILGLLFGVLALSACQSSDCKFRLTGGDDLKFDLKEIRVPKSCENITVTVIHSGKMPLKAMGHNWVLTKTADWNAVASSLSSKFPTSSEDIPKDERILAATKFVGGAEGDPKVATLQIKKSTLATGDYHFFCSFPGHFQTMNGAFILEQ